MTAPHPQLNPDALPFVEELFASYLHDPKSVPAEWHEAFADLARDMNGSRLQLGPSFGVTSVFDPPGAPETGGRPRRALTEDAQALQDRVDQFVRAYRVRGHLLARLDPLGMPRPPQPEVHPDYYGLTEEHMGMRFSAHTVGGAEELNLGQIIERLDHTYCRSIGVQFMHIDDLCVKEWLQERMEATLNRIELDHDQQVRILTKLTDAALFEDFISKKYLGAKRFSLEGAESLIPLLDLAIEKAGEQGVEEIVLAMAHRGRLNVLANIMDKRPRDIFHEFDDDEPEQNLGRGDVKYHLGYSSDRVTASGNKVHLSLCFNPSHLACVSPVALGRMRAKMERFGDVEHRRGLTLLVHGDAAFAGQGTIQETLNMSQLPGYRVGGAIHVIVNNQIGFTTNPEEGRSTPYATGVAKLLGSPIFHVNGEDPEAVAQVITLAMDFREEFQRDVVIDMYAYRRHGHNEGDEPAFTQPLLYAAIQKRKSVRQGYLQHLEKLGSVTRAEADAIRDKRRADLEAELSAARSEGFSPSDPSAVGTVWERYRGGDDVHVPDVDTGLDAARARRLLEDMTRLPEGFQPHKKIARFLEERREMARGERQLNWAAGEALAFAGTVTDGAPVRLSGQDSVRGTFSHRHMAVLDMQSGERFFPLQHLSEGQAPFRVYNSPLSELGVLGFDYGYSLDMPEGLTIWEAQFGDFNNMAQVIIDQFISSAEDKWSRYSGLVMLLPHGFEGMGPEHSSARLERFLELAAQDNMQIANPTTPAQMFHLLRRQVMRTIRKPLVVMTPKSLLRHPSAVSSLEECTRGTFRRVLPETEESLRKDVERVLLCSGKVYYDLVKTREELGDPRVAILRLEQLYPLPLQQLHTALSAYSPDVEVVFVQEEPENMGAWRFVRYNLGDRLFESHPFRGIFRPESASPATGSAAAHRMEQEALCHAAFARA